MVGRERSLSIERVGSQQVELRANPGCQLQLTEIDLSQSFPAQLAYDGSEDRVWDPTGVDCVVSELHDGVHGGEDDGKRE
jgi:hypothetical protein